MKSKNDMCMCCNGSFGSCCMSVFGVTHVVGGIGIGFLLAYYFQLPIMMVGWALVAVGIVGHLFGKMKCDHCA